MKQLWITIVKNYIRIGLFFYYKKINVVGKENIPKKGAVMFVSNHQNALIDPLIIGTTNGRNTHFLTRAGVFKRKLIIRFFNSVQMIPIYRVRDGWNTIPKNIAIINKCINLLHKNNVILIFPEGGHNLARRIRVLSKGFTRILFGTFEIYPEMEIQIVPVGLNYDHILDHPASCSVYYGKPIDAKKFWNPNDIFTSTNELKEVVRNEMKVLTTHIEDLNNYDKIVNALNNDNADFLDPIATNIKIETLSLNPNTTTYKNKSSSIIRILFIANSLIPWLLWKKVQPIIKELEFTSTFRFAFGITLFPSFYVIQSFLIGSIFTSAWGYYYLFTSILIGLLNSKFTSR
ncbi:1-acyl-sn-glycerol-3-phosphate acyltransferase [Urechidicola vernalis]|uniref:1-acyl-sn-glycerol-3-phosphate acyltransferase n=1 Tax=Urechidicola vernalis TaxID=3075600 RepID=A0ABU2YAP8_9FLAO|nr:1-acyl-sn-glycerol-3-phosphate acyltransferase [Urechidicola sp. P050]MDT0554320.1 1-acyl-sn-glycerol-3-phosphate acyltransferase [Urechidicola sp. P050]